MKKNELTYVDRAALKIGRKVLNKVASSSPLNKPRQPVPLNPSWSKMIKAAESVGTRLWRQKDEVTGKIKVCGQNRRRYKKRIASRKVTLIP